MKPEAKVQRDIRNAARSLGFEVYDLSQARRQYCPHCGGDLGKGASGSRQTPGLSDLYLVHPAKNLTVWVEVKAGANRPTEHQQHFLVQVRRAGGHAFPAWCTSDFLHGLYAADFELTQLPPWEDTSKRFRHWLRALYPVEHDPDHPLT